MSRLSIAARTAAIFTAVIVTAPAVAHHGFGRFDSSRMIELEGKITSIDFVNPHAYLYFDAVAADGKVTAMRCEMRAATVLRRSGWTAEMFVKGSTVHIEGNPHRDDPASCYIETIKIGDAPTLERYQQFTEATQPVQRTYRLASGKPNLGGDWAQEQYLIARPPSGRGNLVPKSMVAKIESGEIPISAAPGAGWGAAPVTLTEAGRAASAALRAIPQDQTTRARCEITSVLFDWVFDGPVNRITQTDDTITFEYGRGLKRTVHMNMTAHPANITPSRGGHSIGRWDGDVLVVDTAGFSPGSLAGTTPHGTRLHVVERFTLDPTTFALKRDYVAEDPEHFSDQYIGSDIVMPADAPYAEDTCKELTYVNYSETGNAPAN
jgi:hypothetical protein